MAEDYDKIIEEIIDTNNTPIHPNPSGDAQKLTQYQLIAIEMNQIILNKLTEINLQGKDPSKWEIRLYLQAPINLNTIIPGQKFIYPDQILKFAPFRTIPVKTKIARGLDGQPAKPEQFVAEPITSDQVMLACNALLKEMAKERGELGTQYRKFLKIAYETDRNIVFAQLLRGIIASRPFPGPIDPATPPCSLLTQIPAPK